MDEIARLTMLILSVLVLIGGVIGYLKGKSNASLIAGLVCSAIYAGSYFLSMPHYRSGVFLADVVSVALVVIGIKRFSKTKKFMPAGLMIVFGAVGIAILSITFVQHMV